MKATRAVNKEGDRQRLARPQRRAVGAVSAFLIASGGPVLVVLVVAPWSIPNALAVAAIIDLLPVMAAGAIGGPVWGVFGSLLSTITLGLAFLAPRSGSVPAPQARDAIPLAAFFVVSTIASRLVAAERRGRIESQEMRERLHFLVRCDQVFFETALAFDRTVTALASLCVPALAEIAMVNVARDGVIDTAALAYGSNVRAQLADSLQHQAQPPRDAKYGVGAVMRSGRSELYSSLDAETIAKVARNERHAALLKGLGIQSCMFIPWRIAGRIEGVVVLASVSKRRPLTQDHLDLAEQIVARAGTAVELARVHADKSNTALVLQEALLPTEVPAVDGLEIEARFLPYGSEDLVGGDFYDIFDTGDGRLIVFVGDVCGKGAAAAAIAGLARHSLRVIAQHQGSPAAMLRELNTILLRSGSASLCTLVLGAMRPVEAGWRVTIVRGGHPPALMRTPDAMQRLLPRGVLLGVLPAPEFDEVVVDLTPGDSIAFYTDGLLDERRSDAEEQLADVMMAIEPHTAKHVADVLMEQPVGSQPHDDKAVVVMSVPL